MKLRRQVNMLLVFLTACSVLTVYRTTPAYAVANPNLAFGKTVYANTSLESGGYGKSKLTDGVKTQTASSMGYKSTGTPGSNHTEWITVDLGTSQPVTEIDLYPLNDLGEGFPVSFTIQYSTDNVNWSTVTWKPDTPNPGRFVKRIPFDGTTITARYFKVNVTSLANVSGYYLQLSEIELYTYETPNPFNLAVGKSVTASSSNETNGFSASGLVDGIASSIPASQGWTSTANTGVNHTESVQIDLGYTYPLGEIVLHSGAGSVGFPIDYTIQVSPDNSTWTTVAARTGQSEPGFVRQDFLFNSTMARYVKVTGTSLRNLAGYGYVMRLGEIEVYGDQSNLALKKRVTASSSIEDANWGVAKVVDGYRDSTTTSSWGWSNSNGIGNHTEWVQIDLGQTFGVGQVDLYPENSSGQGFPIDFTIQTSTNGSTWTPVVTRTAYPNPGGAKQTFTFTNTIARYVRVQGTNLWQTGGFYYMQFAEIAVYRNTVYTDTSTVDYTMEAVAGSASPLITQSHPGSSGNAFGYETGHAIKLSNGEYRMTVTEMIDPNNAWVPARMGLWKSTDGNTWTRLSTLGQGNNIPGDPHNNTWDPTFIFNTAENRWNILFRGYATVFRLISTVSGTGGIDGPYTEAAAPVTPIQGAPKYWDSPGTPASFSNIYTVGSKYYAFISGGYVNWNNALVSADSIAGPWTQDNTKERPDLIYSENPIIIQLADGTYVCVFDEINNGLKNLGFGYSLDGIHWVQKSFDIPVAWADTQGPVWSVRTPLSIIPESDGTFTVYFTAKNAGSNYYDIGKVSVKINKFTKGKALSASSTYSSSWTAVQAGDASNATAWSSVWQPSSTGAEWIAVDKFTPTTVNSVSVYPRTSGGVVQCFPQDFKLQSSLDGQNWSDIPGQTYTNYANPSNAQLTFTFGTPIQTRFVRMYATKFRPDGVGGYYMQLAEFKANP